MSADCLSADCRLYQFGGLSVGGWSFGGLSIDCYCVGGLSDNHKKQGHSVTKMFYPITAILNDV